MRAHFEHPSAFSPPREQALPAQEEQGLPSAKEIGTDEWRKIQKHLLPALEKARWLDDGSAEYRMLGYGFWTKTSQELTKRYGLPACGGLLLNAFMRSFVRPDKSFAHSSDEEYAEFLVAFFREAIGLLETAKAEKAERRQGPVARELRRQYNAEHQPFGIEAIPFQQAKHDRFPNQRRAHLERIINDLPSKQEVIAWLQAENKDFTELQAAYRAVKEGMATQEVDLRYPEGEAMFAELLGKEWRTALIDMIPKAFRYIPRRIEVHSHELPDDHRDNASPTTLGTWHSVRSRDPFRQKHLGQANNMMRLYARPKNAKGQLVNTFIHELGHGISGQPDSDYEQYQVNRLFLEAIANERPRYSSYVAKSYRKGFELGLGEDFSESFAQYFTDAVVFHTLQPKRYAAIERILKNVFSVSETEIVRLRELESKNMNASFATEFHDDGPSLKRTLLSMPSEDLERCLNLHFPTHVHKPLAFALFDRSSSHADQSSRFNFTFDTNGCLASASIHVEDGDTVTFLKDAIYDQDGRLTAYTGIGDNRFIFTYEGTERIPTKATFARLRDTADEANSGEYIPEGIITYTRSEKGFISERCQTQLFNRDVLTNYFFHPDGTLWKTVLFYFNERIATQTLPRLKEPETPYRGLLIAIDAGEEKAREIVDSTKRIIPWKVPALNATEET